MRAGSDEKHSSVTILAVSLDGGEIYNRGDVLLVVQPSRLPGRLKASRQAGKPALLFEEPSVVCRACFFA
jgi:hypothetical protein